MSKWLEGLKWAEQQMQQSPHYGMTGVYLQMMHDRPSTDDTSGMEFHKGAADYIRHYSTVLKPLGELK